MNSLSILIKLSILALLLPTFTGAAKEAGCDQPKTEKGFCCDEHELLTAKKLASNVVYHQCEDCDELGSKPGDCEELTAKAGKCTECGTRLTETEAKALIEHRCPGGDTLEYKPGTCAQEECGSRGKPLERVCSESGRFPHAD